MELAYIQQHMYLLVKVTKYRMAGEDHHFQDLIHHMRIPLIPVNTPMKACAEDLALPARIRSICSPVSMGSRWLAGLLYTRMLQLQPHRTWIAMQAEEARLEDVCQAVHQEIGARPIQAQNDNLLTRYTTPHSVMQYRRTTRHVQERQSTSINFERRREHRLILCTSEKDRCEKQRGKEKNKWREAGLARKHSSSNIKDDMRHLELLRIPLRISETLRAMGTGSTLDQHQEGDRDDRLLHLSAGPQVDTQMIDRHLVEHPARLGLCQATHMGTTQTAHLAIQTQDGIRVSTMTQDMIMKPLSGNVWRLIENARLEEEVHRRLDRLLRRKMSAGDAIWTSKVDRDQPGMEAIGENSRPPRCWMPETRETCAEALRLTDKDDTLVLDFPACASQLRMKEDITLGTVSKADILLIRKRIEGRRMEGIR